jgi:hypothetical protein
MARAVATGELISPCARDCRDRAVRFELATAAHDAGIRKLLRETPMRGRVSVTLEHEPSHFAAIAIEGTEQHSIVGLDERDRVIAVGNVSARTRFINGEPMRVGYLGGLRVAESHQGRASVVRRGYQLLRELHENDGPSIYLTSIIADNHRARRLLERGLPGMPTYRFIGNFVTLLLPTRHRTSAAPFGRSRDVAALNDHQRRHQFAPLWSPAELPDTFCVVGNSCAAIWDQRAFEQTVIRGYSRGLRLARPFINAIARVNLPAVGTQLSLAFISHVGGDVPIDQLLAAADTDYLVIGFDARDPRLDRICSRFRSFQYASRLYTVSWDDEGDRLASSLDDRLLAPEVALL